MNEPGGGRGGGSAEDHLQSLFFRHGDDAVKEGEVKAALLRLHPVPGKLTDADHIAAQLQNAVHIGLHQGGVPLFGIVVDS